MINISVVLLPDRFRNSPQLESALFGMCRDVVRCLMMHDRGCHWFSVGGEYTKSVVRHGPVRLLNQDEAALKIKGPGGTKIDRVLGTVTLRAKGAYHITMVGQAPRRQPPHALDPLTRSTGA